MAGLLTILINRSPKLMNWYPPFLGAGIRVKSIARDFRQCEVVMNLRWWNRNYVGTQFGGSLYMMADPFFMMMMMHQLGPSYIVWDKAATIHFRNPGRGSVHCVFLLTDEEIASARCGADTHGKCDCTLHASIIDDAGSCIAEVEKVLYIRRRKPGETYHSKRSSRSHLSESQSSHSDEKGETQRKQSM
ncbi:MAG: DUF4442 domain-containing protein [Candidatus Dormibacteria bacterium]